MKLLVSIIAMTAIFGCAERRSSESFRYSNGQFVCMAIDGAKAQVIWRDSLEGGYQVRIPVRKLDTNSRVFGQDAPITTQPYTSMYVREFEITECHK